jgi:hypothetical protein
MLTIDELLHRARGPRPLVVLSRSAWSFPADPTTPKIRYGHELGSNEVWADAFEVAEPVPRFLGGCRLVRAPDGLWEPCGMTEAMRENREVWARPKLEAAVLADLRGAVKARLGVEAARGRRRATAEQIATTRYPTGSRYRPPRLCPPSDRSIRPPRIQGLHRVTPTWKSLVEIARKQLAAGGIMLGPMIGQGESARVWEVENALGWVVKLTGDPSDARAFANVARLRAAGRIDTSAIAEVACVYAMPRRPRARHGLYAIFMERLAPLAGDDYHYADRVLSAFAIVSGMDPTARPAMLRKALAQAEGAVRRRAGSFLRSVEALYDAGIEVRDLHGGNVLRRPRERVWKITDLGFARSPDIEVPVWPAAALRRGGGRGWNGLRGGLAGRGGGLGLGRGRARAGASSWPRLSWAGRANAAGGRVRASGVVRPRAARTVQLLAVEAEVAAYIERHAGEEEGHCLVGGG